MIKEDLGHLYVHFTVAYLQQGGKIDRINLIQINVRNDEVITNDDEIIFNIKL